jgi:hypothetical protein
VITLTRFRRLEAILRRHGYGEVIDWSESIQPPTSAEAFAEEVIYVICNSGMAVTVGAPLARRCIARLGEGGSASEVFAHPGKQRAIDEVWRDRSQHFAGFQLSRSKLEFLQSLPWIGPVTRYHLAKNLGADVAKPDVHMERLARRDRTTTRTLCRRLGRRTGYRVATIDSILWRACADGLLKSRVYEAEGWRSAFRPDAYDVELTPLEFSETESTPDQP